MKSSQCCRLHIHNLPFAGQAVQEAVFSGFDPTSTSFLQAVRSGKDRSRNHRTWSERKKASGERGYGFGKNGKISNRHEHDRNPAASPPSWYCRVSVCFVQTLPTSEVRASGPERDLAASGRADTPDQRAAAALVNWASWPALSGIRCSMQTALGGCLGKECEGPGFMQAQLEGDDRL